MMVNLKFDKSDLAHWEVLYTFLIHGNDMTFLCLIKPQI